MKQGDKMKFFNKRLDLNDSEFDCLRKYIDFGKMEEVANKYKEECIELKLLEKLNNPKVIEYSQKKVIASFRATESRTKKAKEKIQNAINILRLENKSITHYSIAQTSGVSFNTVKKYIMDIDKVGKIE